MGTERRHQQASGLFEATSHNRLVQLLYLGLALEAEKEASWADLAKRVPMHKAPFLVADQAALRVLLQQLRPKRRKVLWQPLWRHCDSA